MQIQQAVSCWRKYWCNIFEWPSLSAHLAKIIHWFRIISELLFLTFPLTYFWSFLICFMSFYRKAVSVAEIQRDVYQILSFTGIIVKEGGGGGTNARMRLGSQSGSSVLPTVRGHPTGHSQQELTYSPSCLAHPCSEAAMCFRR